MPELAFIVFVVPAGVKVAYRHGDVSARRKSTTGGVYSRSAGFTAGLTPVPKLAKSTTSSPMAAYIHTGRPHNKI